MRCKHQDIWRKNILSRGHTMCEGLELVAQQHVQGTAKMRELLAGRRKRRKIIRMPDAQNFTAH